MVRQLICYNTLNRKRPMTRFDLTPDEQRAIAEATPQDWVKAAAAIATDRHFWQELGSTMLQSFINGFERGRNR